MSQVEVIASDRWFDESVGTLDRRVFSDSEIYRQELKRVFARAWNFICHESQISEPGRFFTSYIGEDKVIAVRDRQGNVQVLLNSCSHRGNTVCRAEQGSTNSFFCTYHGWNFDLDGTLVGVPNLGDFYRNDLDKEALGLAKAAQVESYKGFVFATLDPLAPPLDTYLGWVGRLGLDMIAEAGDLEVIDGIQKNRLQCNWKVAVDNLFDWYHPKVSHGSAIRIGLFEAEGLYLDQQMIMLGEYGHAIGGPCITPEEHVEFKALYKGNEEPSIGWDAYARWWRSQGDAESTMGPVGVRSYGHTSIFPNLWVASTGTQLCLRLPRGPQQTELWWFSFAAKDAAPETRRMLVRNAIHIFGPGGLLEQDDGENWSHSTRGSQGEVTRRRPVNYSMGLGHDQMQVDPSGQARVETVVNEHGQRWTYKAWEEWMRAENWPQLIQSHSAPPTGLV